MKNNKIIFGILIAFVFLLSMGFTYAYFSVTVNVQGEARNVEASTGTLTVLYTDGPGITATSIIPGWTTTKTFTVKNTGTLTAIYNIAWASLTNTITNNELVMSATCAQTLNSSTSGTCTGLTETAVAASAGNIKTNVSIAAGYTHTYTVTFLFKETSTVQNYNQGKTFTGLINIVSAG